MPVFLCALSCLSANFWGVILVGKTTSLRLVQRYNRCNRENTVRILTLPKNEDFRLHLAAKMTTAKIETLTEVQIYLVFGRDSLGLSLGALVLATVSSGGLGSNSSCSPLECPTSGLWCPRTLVLLGRGGSHMHYLLVCCGSHVAPVDLVDLVGSTVDWRGTYEELFEEEDEPGQS